MATTSTFTAVAAAGPLFTEPERLALAGFLAGYTGLTREAYALDLRQFASWCQEFHIGLFQARRAGIECFARDLEARARATVTRRLCTVAGSCRYATEEELLDHSPAAHVRRPRLDYESHATRLDRNELGAILAAAGLAPPAEHAANAPSSPLYSQAVKAGPHVLVSGIVGIDPATGSLPETRSKIRHDRRWRTARPSSRPAAPAWTTSSRWNTAHQPRRLRRPERGMHAVVPVRATDPIRRQARRRTARTARLDPDDSIHHLILQLGSH
jgi:hypothetical protein